MTSSAAKAIRHYEAAVGRVTALTDKPDPEWEKLFHLIEAEWEIVKSMADAVGAGLDFGGVGEERQQ